MGKLNELAEKCYSISETRRSNGAKLENGFGALKDCASEVVEAERARVGMMDAFAVGDLSDSEMVALRDGFAEELADIIICVLVSAQQFNIDIDKALEDKVIKNLKRSVGKGDKV